MRLQQICVYSFSAATCIRRRKNSVMRFPHATRERPKGKGLNAKPHITTEAQTALLQYKVKPRNNIYIHRAIA